MNRLNLQDKNRDKDRGKEKTPQRDFQRSENVFDNPLDVLMNDLPEDESVDEPEFSEADDETPVDGTDDEDFEESENYSYNDILFEGEFSFSKTKRAFLVIAQIGNERKSVLQNLRFPRFQVQKPDLETKAKILKYIGDYIIKEARFLIDVACAGKDLPEEGTLGQKKLAEELRRKIKTKSGKSFSVDTLTVYLSKIRRFENIQLPNGKIYSLKQFLGGAGKKPEADQVDYLKFLGRREEKGDTELAREFINENRIVLTAENEQKTQDEYRSRFKNLKKYLKEHQQKIPSDWTTEESAEFYLSERNLPCEVELIETVSGLLKKMN